MELVSKDIIEGDPSTFLCLSPSGKVYIIIIMPSLDPPILHSNTMKLILDIMYSKSCKNLIQSGISNNLKISLKEKNYKNYEIQHTHRYFVWKVIPLNYIVASNLYISILILIFKLFFFQPKKKKFYTENIKKLILKFKLFQVKV